MKKSSKLRVALVVLNSPSSGGAYNYEFGVIDELVREKDLPIEFLIFAPTSLVGVTRDRYSQLRVRPYRSGLLTMIFLGLRNSLPGYKLLKFLGLRYGRFERALAREGVSLAYFLSPNALVLDLVDTPTINTLWDLGHRDIPEFIEITGNRHFEERELFYRHALPKSFRVIVDTEQTSDRIQAIYGVNKDRVIIGGLPAIRPQVQESRLRAAFPYFLYPAQFWPHKRHALLLEAFRLVCEQNADCKLILTGHDKGNLEHVVNVSQSLGISSRVEFKGFVSNIELAGLMNDAVCVVFPSQLGPSNLPPLEAALLGTKSLVSGVHTDPRLRHPLITTVPTQNPEDWAMAMLGALANQEIRFEPLSQFNSTLISPLCESLLEFRARRKEWASIEDQRFKRK